MAEDYGFFDSNKDGMVTKEELLSLSKQISADEGLPLPGPEQLAFSMRLWDLNGDGTLTAEELLRALALDGAVSDDAVDAQVLQVFDSNSDGFVDAAEFSKGLGDLGSHGDATKAFIFTRVDRVASESSGKLDTTDFGNALVLARTVVLGY